MQGRMEQLVRVARIAYDSMAAYLIACGRDLCTITVELGCEECCMYVGLRTGFTIIGTRRIEAEHP